VPGNAQSPPWQAVITNSPSYAGGSAGASAHWQHVPPVAGTRQPPYIPPQPVLHQPSGSDHPLDGSLWLLGLDGLDGLLWLLWLLWLLLDALPPQAVVVVWPRYAGRSTGSGQSQSGTSGHGVVFSQCIVHPQGT